MILFNRIGTLQHYWPFIYAHRDAEDTINAHQDEETWEAPDFVSSNTPREDVPDGIHDCLVYDQPAKLFLWTDKELVQYILPVEKKES